MELARLLGAEQPVRALQSPSLYGATEPTRLEDAAEQYLAQIRAVQPSGPYGSRRPDDLTLVRAFPSVLRQYAGKPASFSRARLERLQPEERVALMIDDIRASGALPPEVDSAGIRLLFEAWKTHLLAVQAHRPAPLAHAQPIVFFQARQKESRALLRLLDISLPKGIELHGWQPLTCGRIELHHVPGSHFTMLNSSNVGPLAEILRTRLAEVAAR